MFASAINARDWSATLDQAPLKLLVVDANPFDVRQLQEMLWEVSRIEVQQHPQVAGAVEAARHSGCDAVLLDLSIVPGDSLQTFQLIHRQLPTIPIVALTGTHDEALGLQAVRHGAQDYLVKGHFDGSLLLRSVFYAIERKRAEWALVRSHQECSALEAEVMEISHREQRRIGQDLHDTVGQELTGLSYLARSLAKKLEHKSPAEAAEASAIADRLQHALRSVRGAIQGLVPVDVDEHGLMAALHRLADTTREMFDLDCRFECDQPVAVGDNRLATHLYRIAQEATHNAVKHAGASRIVLSLCIDGERLELRVRDDGMGVTESSGQADGLGVHIMQYRARAIGGRLEIEPAAGGGTLVSCILTAEDADGSA